VLSGTVLYDELITRPEESYLLWCVVVCESRNHKNPREWGGGQGPLGGYGAKRGRKKRVLSLYFSSFSHENTHIWWNTSCAMLESLRRCGIFVTGRNTSDCWCFQIPSCGRDVSCPLFTTSHYASHL